MQTVNLDILGIAETHWTEEGKIIQENHTMIYSGGEKHRNAVGIVMKNSVEKNQRWDSGQFQSNNDETRG